MEEEEFLKEALEVEEEMHYHIPRKKSPLWTILGIALALSVVFMVIPYYGIRLDPSPGYIPTISEVVRDSFVNDSPSSQITLEMVDGSDPLVKGTADRIVSLACDGGKVCQSKALFYFVRDNFDYVSDPTAVEYIKTARSSLYSQGGDCDDGSVLLANLLDAIGIRTRFVFIPGHVYIEAYIPEALNRYKVDNWVILDPTCSYCSFGEVPWKNVDADKRYLG